MTKNRKKAEGKEGRLKKKRKRGGRKCSIAVLFPKLDPGYSTA